MRTIVKRLKPDEELFSSIEEICRQENIEAGVVLSLVGSLKRTQLRFANRQESVHVNGPFEIVSATGTVAKSGSHLHISVSDGTGTVYGGHLVPGSLVYTTVEVVLMDLSATTKFERMHCQLSGFEELAVIELNGD